MKQTLLIFIALLLRINTYSQTNMPIEYEEWKSSPDEYENFDIAKYYTPNIVRNQLPVYVNLNSNYARSSSDYTTLNLYNELFEHSASSKKYDLMGHVTSTFWHYVNTRKKISNLGISLILDEGYSFQKTNQSALSNTFWNQNTVISENSTGVYWSNKWYLSKLFYLNYSIYDCRMSYYFTQNKIKADSGEGKPKKNAFGFKFFSGLGMGYGRMEDVEDARQAVYIANALSKKNVLTRNLSNEELFELSQKISTVKNKRFLDSRLHLTDEISTVDSFFVNKNLLNDTGAAYFTTLYDMWQYGALYSRQSGYELSFSVHPYYTYNHTKELTDIEVINNSHQATLEAHLVFNYEKPVKLNWQHSVETGTYASFQQGKAGETDFNSLFSTKTKTFSAWASYSLSYYPNTRTQIRATAAQQIRKIKQTDYAHYTYYNYTPWINVDISYYFSPHLSIAGNFNLNYEYYYNKNNDTAGYSKLNKFNTLFNIQFIYSIF